MIMSKRKVMHQPDDRRICEALLLSSQWKGNKKSSIHELVIAVGKHFLDAPYEANTLESAGGETLVINLRQFDCFTFLENCVVLARLIFTGKTSFNDHKAELEKVRYRRGKLKDYSSRLHYFSDWLYDNENKGVVKAVTGEIGGKPVLKKIDFMTSHSETYPPLKNGQFFREMLAVERRLSGQVRHIVPKAGFGRVEGKIKDGSLIGITTDMEGLDVAHVGFAVWKDHRIHLLHASGKEGRVILSEKTLNHCLIEDSLWSGVMVAKVLAE